MKDETKKVLAAAGCGTLSDSSFILHPSSLPLLPSSFHHFAVTTPGLTATRWLSHVLASNPDVYVAHGKFALDSVASANFGKEKETVSLESLTRGNETRAFYENRPLEEVLSLYHGLKPRARAHGCVHSYTMHTLAQAARRAETLDGMHIVNVIRHPVDWIASHDALVRSSEQHPRLYQHYLDEVFPQVLRQFPELFLLKCPDYRAFVAFAISCHVIGNLLFDMCYPGIRHVKMEVLTTDAEALRDVCQELTGLEYSIDALAEFIRAGAINRHRAGRARTGPNETYAAWESWQRDMAHMMIPGLLLDWLERMDYDVAMFRDRSASSASDVNSLCLADCLASMDQGHPLLTYKTQTGSSRAQAIESDLQGFRLERLDDRYFAVSNALGMTELSQLDAYTLHDLHDDGLCIMGTSVGELWRNLAQVLAGAPKLVEEYRGFNVIAYRDKWFAAKKGVAVNLESLRASERKKLVQDGRLLVGQALADLKKRIDSTEGSNS